MGSGPLPSVRKCRSIKVPVLFQRASCQGEIAGVNAGQTQPEPSSLASQDVWSLRSILTTCWRVARSGPCPVLNPTSEFPGISLWCISYSIRDQTAETYTIYPRNFLKKTPRDIIGEHFTPSGTWMSSPDPVCGFPP